MVESLRIGQVLFGFCGGYFGRDSYNNKRVEALGADWVVVRDMEDGTVQFHGGAPEDLLPFTRPEVARFVSGGAT